MLAGVKSGSSCSSAVCILSIHKVFCASSRWIRDGIQYFAQIIEHQDGLLHIQAQRHALSSRRSRLLLSYNSRTQYYSGFTTLDRTPVGEDTIVTVVLW